MATVPSSQASREMPTEHSQPAAAPAQLTVNPATNDLTLNPGDTRNGLRNSPKRSEVQQR